jgi:hypothetical protein
MLAKVFLLTSPPNMYNLLRQFLENNVKNSRIHALNYSVPFEQLYKPISKEELSNRKVIINHLTLFG